MKKKSKKSNYHLKDEHGLTPKQRAFADEYVITLNATVSYKKIYSVKRDSVASTNGSRLLGNANVKAYIDKRLEEIKSAKVADQQEVMEYLTSVMRGEKTEPLLVLDGEGTQKIVDSVPSVQTRTKAAELLGKRYSLFTDKQEVCADVDLNITVDYGDTDEDIGSSE